MQDFSKIEDDQKIEKLYISEELKDYLFMNLV